MADTDEKSYSGELFDLSIPSINDRFGAMHIIGVMQYGINFPLSKFIKELQLIIASGNDDKTAKRQDRLNFLMHCNGNKELRQFFILFCNYLNGQDGSGKQYPNHMVITAAGGNIMILFAQLIKNIIENSGTNLMSSNQILLQGLSILTGNSIKFIIDSIKRHFTSPEMFKMLQEVAESEASDCDFKLSPNIIQLIDNPAVDIISRMFRELEIEPPKGGNAKIGGVKYGRPRILRSKSLDSDSSSSQEAMDLDSSQPQSSQGSSGPSSSDLEDVRNLEQRIKQLQITEIDELAKIAEIFAKIKIDAPSDVIDSDEEFIQPPKEFMDLLMLLYANIGSNTEAAGFLLYRIKTLITNFKNYISRFTPQQIQKYKANCSKEKKKLYPQIIQQQHLDEIRDKRSGCFKYLDYLMTKKRIIRWLTTLAVYEIIDFHSKPAINMTDALINYIRIVTSNTNNYIGQWLNGSLSTHAAPGYNSGHAFTISYIDVCRNFSSLNKIVSDNNGMIPLLCGDILYYFLNNPNYNSEKILDNILKRFNSEREKTNKQPCVMPPSTIRLIQFLSLPIDSRYLIISKNIIQEKLDETGDKLGLPDGANLTINPIMTDRIKDIEYIKNIAREMDFTNEMYFIDELQEITESRTSTDLKGIKKPTPRLTSRRTPKLSGGNKYYKKNITLKNKKMVKNIKYELKNKKIKHKTRKHTSKKHKTRKHKSKKHKM